MNVRNDIKAWSKIPGFKPSSVQSAAHAANVPMEEFTKTDRTGVESSIAQGKMAKAFGAPVTDVQVTENSVTFTGKALEKVQASMRELAANTSGGLTGCPPGVLGCKQLCIASYKTPKGGRGQLEYTSGIVTNPKPDKSAVAQMSYLLSPGPGH